MTSTSSAAGTGLPSFTRRGIAVALGAAPVAIATAVPALSASAHPDAALLALREPYERTLAGAEAVSPDHSAAEDAYYAAKERYPGLDRVALERMSGLDVAEVRWQAALDLNSDVIGQIIDVPARTLEGLIFKARICERESMHVDLAEAIVADLVAMGGRDA